MTDRPHTTATDLRNGTTVRLSLDLSRVATDEQVITREDWNEIPELLGLSEVDKDKWNELGPSPREYVRRNGQWRAIWPDGKIAWTVPVTATTAAICDLAVPHLVARDSRLPEVGR